MPDSNEVVPDPRLEKRTRRRFSVAERKRLLAEADALPCGEKGAWLRRKGLYAGQLSTWRKELAEHGEANLAARKPGRKAADPCGKKIERLKKAKARRSEPAKIRTMGSWLSTCWPVRRALKPFQPRSVSNYPRLSHRKMRRSNDYNIYQISSCRGR